MRQYLGSQMLQSKIVEFFRRPEKVVAAICHGPLLIARSIDPQTGKSVLYYNRRTTCLPLYMERTAYLLTYWKMGDYYCTYDKFCALEVQSFLQNPETQYVRGQVNLVAKGTDKDDRHAFVLEDANYLSARWPGDTYLLAKKMLLKLEQANTSINESPTSAI